MVVRGVSVVRELKIQCQSHVSTSQQNKRFHDNVCVCAKNTQITNKEATRLIVWLLGGVALGKLGVAAGEDAARTKLCGVQTCSDATKSSS